MSLPQPSAHDAPLLSVRDLTVELRTDDGIVRPIEQVSFDVQRGEVFGVVGESGSGKSVTMMSMLGLIDQQSVQQIRGRAELDGTNLVNLDQRALRQVRGGEVGLVFQDPLSALNPTMTVGGQIAEAIRYHQRDVSATEIHDRVVELLDEVGIPSPLQRAGQYPFEFSGGMRQRVMIAMAIANNPKLVIADEPTTALDVTIQAQVLDTLRQLTEQRGSALVLITHDLGVIAELADRVMVMYAGRVVEVGGVDDIFDRPRHPYTRGLLRSRPTRTTRGQRLEPIGGSPPGLIDRPAGCAFHSRCVQMAGRDVCRTVEPDLRATDKADQLSACHFTEELAASTTVAALASRDGHKAGRASVTTEPVMSIGGLDKEFRVRRSSLLERHATLTAVRDASFNLYPGRTLGLVGESGSGKSTVARLLVRIVDLTRGQISLDGEDIGSISRRRFRPLRSDIQLVLQDPSSSLNPRMTTQQTLVEALRTHARLSRADAVARMYELLDLVGLRPEHARRYPHEFSAGQRQRVSIARALAVDPKVLVLDEPVSALDVSIRAQVINLLEDLQDRLGVGYLLISHDLSIVHYIADWVAVMYLGRIVETGPAEQVFNAPQHPYTQALLKSAPVDEPSQRRPTGRFVLPGEIPSPLDPPSGCPFRTRCARADATCATTFPPLQPLEADDSQHVACYHPGQPDGGTRVAAQHEPRLKPNYVRNPDTT